MNNDVGWPWWVGLAAVCTVIIVIAYATCWAAGREERDERRRR